MRKIKFRGKRVDNGEWVYGYLLKTEKGTYIFDCDENGNTVYISRHPKKVIPETVGQFTGVQDKNGTEIYEGDIITDNIGNDGIIKWNQDDCSFSIDYFSCDLLESMYLEYQKSIEITGNIHEN